MKYIRQLDAIRAIAVALVIISHWLPEDFILNRIVQGRNGAFGVNIFFVLSGFLITRILLQNRLQAEEEQLRKSLVIKNFFLRRALRIFPIYYITITLLLLFHKYTDTDIAQAYPYFYTYTANLYFFSKQGWDGILSHLWSLSVEEQFYLLWPWIILFLPKKFLKPVIALFIVTGIASNYLLSTLKVNSFTTSCFDAFGLGALLSWQVVYKPEKLSEFYKAVRLVGVVCTVFFLIQLGLGKKILFFSIGSSCIALWLICFVLLKQQVPSLFNKVLKNNVLVWLGKISYGLYLYHLLTPYFFDRVLKKIEQKAHIQFTDNQHQFILLWGSLVILLVVSLASWHLIEKPFLDLKHHFEPKKKMQPIMVKEYVS